MSNITMFVVGQIATPEGADKLRGELLSSRSVRCGDHWYAQATVYSDGAAEIQVSARFDPDNRRWLQHEYYYSFENTIRALSHYEQSGELIGEA